MSQHDRCRAIPSKTACSGSPGRCCRRLCSLLTLWACVPPYVFPGIYLKFHARCRVTRADRETTALSAEYDGFTGEFGHFRMSGKLRLRHLPCGENCRCRLASSGRFVIPKVYEMFPRASMSSECCLSMHLAGRLMPACPAQDPARHRPHRPAASTRGRPVCRESG